jgi:Tfp pilus assembly protein PilF
MKFKQRFITVITILLAALITGCRPGNPDESNKHLKTGIDAFNKGRLDEAENEFNTAIDQNKKNSTAWYYRGILFVTKNNLQRELKILVNH